VKICFVHFVENQKRENFEMCDDTSVRLQFTLNMDFDSNCNDEEEEEDMVVGGY